MNPEVLTHGRGAATVARATARVRCGVLVPLRDGTRLNANLYLPPGDPKPSPCILSPTPYTAARNHLRARYIAEHGYAVLVVDVRGRGNSEGTFRPFIQEAEDGYDIVEWVARQAFCDGRVGMFGGSYAGYFQWATVKQLPPHLVAVAPVSAAAPGIDMTMRNNVCFPYLMQWLTCVTGRASQEPMFGDQPFWCDNFRDWYVSGRPFRELDSLVGNPSPIFQEWLSHPLQDEYWDSYLPAADEFKQVNAPILTLTGSYDANQLGALHFYREHLRNASPEAAARHYLVIGPWDHTGILAPKSQFGGLSLQAAALVDVLKLHVEWYDWVFRGAPRPAFLEQRVAYYVMGAEEWRYAHSLPEITSHSHPFYLDSSSAPLRPDDCGTLQERPGRGSTDSYIYDPADTTVADVESRLASQQTSLPALLLRPIFPVDKLVNQELVGANEGRMLIYQSAAFVNDTELSGFFQLSIWLSIDQPDTDFFAAVYELTPVGCSIFLTSDIMRARYREGLRAEKLIQTIEPLRYDLTRFTFVSRQLQRGSRLRLVIGPLNSVFYQRNHNSGRAVAEESMSDARRVTVVLFHDEARPSALYVPFGRSSAHCPSPLDDR